MLEAGFSGSIPTRSEVATDKGIASYYGLEFALDGGRDYATLRLKSDAGPLFAVGQQVYIFASAIEADDQPKSGEGSGV